MSGEDARMFSAVRRSAVVDGEDVDLGHVGAVTGVRIESISDLLDSGRIPVISSIAPEIAPDGTPTGEVLNINADLEIGRASCRERVAEPAGDGACSNN